MARFVHVDHPNQHPGVARVERAAARVKSTARDYEGARGALAMLLAVVIAALTVVSNQVVDTWTEGHLLAAWIVMWLVAFSALALFAVPLRRAAGVMGRALQGWNARRHEAQADARLWQLAQRDARVMADIARAMSSDAVRDVRGYY